MNIRPLTTATANVAATNAGGTTVYALAPVAFDRRGNVLFCDVTDNYDTWGNVIATTAGEALGFLRGTGRGPATRSCGENHKPGRAYRTVAYHYSGDGYRRVRPMFWTISEDGVVREVWSVTRKVLVFGRGTSQNRPDWAALRRVELAARKTESTPKAQPVTVHVMFTPLNTETTFPAKYYGTPLGINTVTWYQAIDRDTNADIPGWTVSHNHRTNDYVVNGPRGVIDSVTSLSAAAQYISQSINKAGNCMTKTEVTHTRNSERGEDLFQILTTTSDLLGYARTIDTGEEIWIDTIAVHPDHRRQGYGQALLNAILQQFPERPLALSADPFNPAPWFDPDDDLPSGPSWYVLTSWYARHGFRTNHQRTENACMTRP